MVERRVGREQVLAFSGGGAVAGPAPPHVFPPDDFAVFTLGAFVLEKDLDAPDQPPTATGVRLLPAKDAFIQARDRDVPFPDPAHRKAVFPTLGGPGAVLHEALPVGTWRGAAKGRRYEVKVAAFATLTKATWAEIGAEPERVARARGYEAAAHPRWARRSTLRWCGCCGRERSSSC